MKRTAEEIIPVIEEKVIIGTERATTETVRVRTVIHEDEHAIDEPVTITDVEVKRVPVDLWTDEPIADRVEGDTRIISVHREEIMVQRRLHVVEEVHVSCGGEKNVIAKSSARGKRRLLSIATAPSLENEDQQQSAVRGFSRASCHTHE